MQANRSIPQSTVIPELPYADVRGAAAWLCKTFGFAERLRIGDHRIQLTVGDGAVVVVERREPITSGKSCSHGILVRMAGLDEHFTRASRAGATVVREPATHPFGERQYTVEDIGGHLWTFSESVADVHPREWGGELVGEP